ncbi:hypothetical protein D9X30_3346 [Cupriavidus sp. U2]|uniref:hypothetical protein n=1 Tax=Cupriavidus sp. U2 TaxID=2920269 RepID=UPI00129E7E3F|nr:hypothetical protein [Cupriavidus sp. U2]KAI3591521.1 hypothetical protein D9X30_3346 [Cupriavidus sp. U2]
MKNFKSALLIHRYIGELEGQISAQERRIRASQQSGLPDVDAERQLAALRGSLEALRFRARSIPGGR